MGSEHSQVSDDEDDKYESTRARSSERKNSCFGNMRYDGVLVAGFGSVPVAERGASGVLSFATE